MKADEKYFNFIEPTSGVLEEIATLALLIKDTDANIIAFALYRGAANREMAVQALKEHLAIPVAEFTLSSCKKNPVKFINEVSFPERGCIFFFGLEDALPEAAGYLNLQRETFAEVPHAVVFWVTEYGLREIANRAPDFWSWRSGVFDCRVEAQIPFTAMEELSLLPLPFRDHGDFKRTISLYLDLLQEYSRQEKPDKRFLAGLHYKLARDYYFLGKLQEAEVHAQQGLTVNQEIGDKKLEAFLLQMLGSLSLAQDRFDDAKSIFYQVEKIFEHLGDETSLSMVFYSLGFAAWKQKKIEEAELWYHKSLEIHKRLGDETGIAEIYSQLGLIAQERNQLEEAESCFLKALEIFNRFGKELEASIAYHQLGRIAETRNQLEEAESWYQKGLEISERRGEERTVASHYYHLGIIAQQRKQFQEAQEYYHKALDLAERLIEPQLSLPPLGRLGYLHLEQEQYEESLKYLSRALLLAIRFEREPEIIIMVLALLMKFMGEERFKQTWQDINPDQELPLEIRNEIIKEKGMKEKSG